MSAASVSRHWRAKGLKPHLVRGFKVSRDPKSIERLEEVVGRYLAPPEQAIVLCCDEKSQVGSHATGFAAEEGACGHYAHNYKRNGATTLFAALNVFDDTVIFQCQKRHRHIEWLKFLFQIDHETPQCKTLHLICDNYAAHQHQNGQKWLEKHPRFNLHFTPTPAPWLSMEEGFFRDISQNRLRRGVLPASRN